jgi:hypothetical protein
MKPNNLELQDHIFMEIVEGCKKFVLLIDLWMNKEPFELDEIFMLDPRYENYLPKIECDDFE